MPNPFNAIKPVLKIIGENIKILPATGNAVEDVLRHDIDEIEDTIIHRNANLITEFAETPTPSPHNLYRPTPPLYRKENPLFRFFIDGSLRTYFLGTGIEGTRSFPIELAQIGAATIERTPEGNLKVFSHKQKILLLLPKEINGISDTVWSKLQQLDLPELFEIKDYSLPDVINENKKDPRDKAGGKARHEMHKLEIELIDTTNPYRSEDSWLILDGAVKLGDFIKAPYLIGVAKSFRKDPQFYLGKRKKRIDITEILAGLPHEHRTVAFSSYDGQVAFWYVRMREQKEVDYPLMGVIKVELPRPDGTPIPSELADLLSRALVAERNVSPYGLDRRWHACLYTIYIAEQIIKNRFYSAEVLRAAIKWPKPEGVYHAR
jgi:hypothetical protein